MSDVAAAEASTSLATNFSVANYAAAAAVQDRSTIADALRTRFRERYIDPVSKTNAKHGFALMAVSCLMMEALQSFVSGWPHTDRKSEKAICAFLDTARGFEPFRGHGSEFFKHVRCGILHQAETTGGWTIRRSGPLFSPAELRINATVFMRKLEAFVDAYRNELAAAQWQDPVWVNARVKLEALVANCRR